MSRRTYFLKQCSENGNKISLQCKNSLLSIISNVRLVLMHNIQKKQLCNLIHNIGLLNGWLYCGYNVGSLNGELKPNVKTRKTIILMGVNCAT